MTNYKIGRIYKIMYIGNENISINYIGSTFNTIRDRFRTHKSAYQFWINDKNNRSCISIYKYFEEFGLQNFKIRLIKEYTICDKNHLLAMEQLWMNKMNNINKIAAFQILKKGNSKEYQQEYKQQNKEAINEKNKEYQQKNKEAINEYKKDYYQQNKDKVKEKSKNYRENNKNEISEKGKITYTCECSSIVTKSGKSQHLKSKKHQNFINNKQ